MLGHRFEIKRWLGAYRRVVIQYSWDHCFNFGAVAESEIEPAHENRVELTVILAGLMMEDGLTPLVFLNSPAR
jgi:hypothetical protein